MIGFDWVMFAILGWCVFVPATGARQILMIVFVVLMLLWVVLGVAGLPTHWPK